jgi:hypothetical protein
MVGGWVSRREDRKWKILTNYLSSSTSHAGQANIGLLEAGAKRQSWQQPQHGGGWWRRNRARLLSSSCSQYIFFRSCLSEFGGRSRQNNNNTKNKSTKIKAKSDTSIIQQPVDTSNSPPRTFSLPLKFPKYLLLLFKNKNKRFVHFCLLGTKLRELLSQIF